MQPSTRRITLRAADAIVAIAALAALAGCGTATSMGTEAGLAPAAAGGGVPTASSTRITPQTVVMVIRHAEKPDAQDPGFDAQGNEDDSSLTEVGWDRAHRLVDLFDPAPGLPARG